MSQLERNRPDLCIPGTRISLFERAPLEAGRKRGYFRDEATRALLGLKKGDVMEASGTYGAQELAEYPVNFALVRDGTYDQRFLPFVPKRRATTRSPQIDLPQHNKQWKPSKRALKSLWENLQLAVTKAETAAKLSNLPLPDYAFKLVPRLCFQDSLEDPPFEYQFQCWFAPQAHYARWRRIERVASLLDGYSNACYQLRNPGGDDWPCGEPIGIEFDLENVNDNDQDLALAYSFLKVPAQLPSSWVLPDNYSPQVAQAVLLSDGRGTAAGRLSFSPLLELPETDHDALHFSRVRPDYSEHRYNVDGSRLTKQQRKEHDEGESTDMAEDEGSEIGSIDDAPFPSDKIVEITEEEPPVEPQPVDTQLEEVRPEDVQQADPMQVDVQPTPVQPEDSLSVGTQLIQEPNTFSFLVLPGNIVAHFERLSEFGRNIYRWKELDESFPTVHHTCS